MPLSIAIVTTAALRRLGALCLALLLLALTAVPSTAYCTGDQRAIGAPHDASPAAEPWLDGDGAEGDDDAEGKAPPCAAQHPEFLREDARVGRQHRPPGALSWLARWLRRSHASQGPPTAATRTL